MKLAIDDALNMNSHNFNDQQLAINAFLKNGRNIATLKSTEESEIRSYLENYLHKMLLEGKSIVFRVPSLAYFQPFESFLKKHNLESYISYLARDHSIDLIRLDTKPITDIDYQKEAIKSSVLYKHHLKQTHDIFAKYTEPVFGEYSREKLAELLFLAKNKSKGCALDLDLSSKNYIFNKNEFWYLRGRIEKASKFYQSNYGFIKGSDDLSEDIYKDFHLMENRDVVFNYFEKYISDCSNLITEYKQFFIKKRSDMINDLKLRVHEILKIVNDLELQLGYFSIDKDLAPAKKAFVRQKDHLEQQKQDVRARYNLLLEELENIQLFKLEKPVNSWNPDISGILQLCSDIKKAASSSYQIIISKVEDQLEILNANNSDAAELSGIMHKQQDLISALNGSKILKKEVQNLSISAWKNFQFIKAIYSKLRKNLIFLKENLNYGVWRSFEFSLEPKALKIVHALENIETSKWVDCFEYWYFKAINQKFPFENLDEIMGLFQRLEESKFIHNEFDTFRIQNIYDQKCSKASKSELSHWNLILKESKKKDQVEINTQTLLETSSQIFKSKFPIIVVDESYPSQALIGLSCDILIAYNNIDLPSDLMGNSHFESIIIANGRHFKTAWQDKIKHAGNYKEKRYFALNQLHLPDSASTKDQNKTNLELGRVLSSILKNINFTKNFYSAKDFSIITCMTPFCTRLLELELYDLKIKALKYADLDTGIVEDVMLKEDKYKFILLQDGFLDPTLDPEWQISVLRKLQQLGLKVIHISSADLASGVKNRIIDFLEIPELALIEQRLESKSKL